MNNYKSKLKSCIGLRICKLSESFKFLNSKSLSSISCAATVSEPSSIASAMYLLAISISSEETYSCFGNKKLHQNKIADFLLSNIV